jgi:hypothetical protein
MAIISPAALTVSQSAGALDEPHPVLVVQRLKMVDQLGQLLRVGFLTTLRCNRRY